MPFKSEKQRRWMHANNPKMAAKWERKEKKMKREQKVRELIKKMVREELAGLEEAAKRDYKAEYKKFQSSDKSKKYRAELNAYNRKKGTYGNGDGKDASHKGGKIVGFEKESVNRGRAEKSRLKKEGVNPSLVKKMGMAVNRGKDVVVYDKKGKKYSLQNYAADGLEVAVTDYHGSEKSWKEIPIKDIKKIVAEGKLTEGWKPIAKKKFKVKDKTGTYNWEIESGIDTDSHLGKNMEKGTVPKIILFYQHFGEKSKAHPKGYPSSGGNTIYLKHKNGKPFTPQEAKALVNKISNKKIGEFQRKSQFPSGSGQNVFYVDGKFLREGKITERNEKHFDKSVEMIYQDIDRLIKTFNTTDYKKNKNAKKFIHTAKQLKLKLHMALDGITWNVREGKLTEHNVKFTKGEMAKLHTDGELEKADDEGKMHTYIFSEGKITEAKETIFDVAAKVMKDSQMYNYKSRKGMVKVDMQTANLLTKVWKKISPKMKKHLAGMGESNPAGLVQTLWAVAK